ncbi:MAG: Electron transfer flavoprotein alpha subunit [Sedimentibacter sp.]|jgi:electron transfer flavoprotein alpha subunit|nr:Electron transfer flavoprotein alpha subunit [Sedimentibacter sp.]
MASINIIKEKCVGCKICIGSCPFGAIEVLEKKANIGQKCTLCGSCSESCKFGAINFMMERVEREDFSEYKGIWVFAEQRYGKLKTVSIELTSKAKELAEVLQTKVTVVVFGSEVKHLSKELIAYGADDVIIMDAEWLNDFNDHVYGELMIDLIKEYKPEIVLIGATSNGRSIAPFISSTLRTGLTADCTELEIDKAERLLMQTRPAFGGNLMATIICPNSRPQMATVRPKVFKPSNPDYSKKGNCILLTVPSPIEGFVKKIRDIDNDTGLNLTDADIIVSVGRGIGNQKNIQLAQELADALGGALGASRPVVDSGWLPYSQQVGQTGKTVAPKIYIACGISGAIQHLAGLADIEIIVAINNDPDAPIFKMANYCVVGDIKEILPLLTEKIKNKKIKK